MSIPTFLRAFILIVIVATGVFAQDSGTIRGTATLAENELTLPHVVILISELGRSVETGDDGIFEFQQVPPGTYNLVANR
jgi:hypothetical protein